MTAKIQSEVNGASYNLQNYSATEIFRSNIIHILFEIHTRYLHTSFNFKLKKSRDANQIE